MCGVEGLVKLLCKVRVVVGERGLGAGCGVESLPPWFPLGAGLRVRRLPQNHRITESQNDRGWKGPLWII